MLAPPAFVFAAIVDPAVLRRAMPGCETLVPSGRDEFQATLTLDVAGLKGTYTGHVRIADKHPSDSLRFAIDGMIPSGTLRGSAALRLTADGGVTRVACDLELHVGGSHPIEPRLVEAAARKITTDFFVQLAREI